jgi:hypothetical protein
MEVTVEIDDYLIAMAQELSGCLNPLVLPQLGLSELVQCSSARRLSRMGGTMPEFSVPQRRRNK